MSRRLFSFFGACAVAFTELLAHATTMVPLDLSALTKRAEVVVSGHITASQPSWTSGHDAIYTDVTMQVERVLNGPLTPGQTLVIRCEGGSVDGVGMRIPGAPAFTVGEEAVVFVERRGAARYVVGMSQGKLTVTTAADGSKHVHRNLSGLGFTRAPTEAERTLAAAGPIDTVDQLETAVRTIAAHK